MENEKHIPYVGEHLYIRSKTNNYWIDMIRVPYTVIEVKGNICKIQEARCIFNHTRYFDTLADDIVEDKNGEILTLRWSNAKNLWQESPQQSNYPRFGVFGEYDYQPYLN